jgi:hypothetical protein
MLEPNWAPTLEYVAIPLGSSSAAPVTKPGPNILSVFRNQLSDLGEVSVTVAPANSRISGSVPIGSLVEASDSSFPFGDKFTRSVRIERADPSYYLIPKQYEFYPLFPSGYPCFYNGNFGIGNRRIVDPRRLSAEQCWEWR